MIWKTSDFGFLNNKMQPVLSNSTANSMVWSFGNSNLYHGRSLLKKTCVSAPWSGLFSLCSQSWCFWNLSQTSCSVSIPVKHPAVPLEQIKALWPLSRSLKTISHSFLTFLSCRLARPASDTWGPCRSFNSWQRWGTSGPQALDAQQNPLVWCCQGNHRRDSKFNKFLAGQFLSW